MYLLLGPGQMNSQEVASSHKLNLCLDLRWVAKRTPRFLPSTRKSHRNPFQGRHMLCFIANKRLMDVTQLAFTWVGYLAKRWKTCVDLHVTLILTKVKVNAGARKTWSNGVASRPNFSTCDYLSVLLPRALNINHQSKSNEMKLTITCLIPSHW